LRKLFSQERAKDSLRRSLITRKTLERLVQIATGNGDLAEGLNPQIEMDVAAEVAGARAAEAEADVAEDLSPQKQDET
jgi:hypothetical protein